MPVIASLLLLSGIFPFPPVIGRQPPKLSPKRSRAPGKKVCAALPDRDRGSGPISGEQMDLQIKIIKINLNYKTLMIMVSLKAYE
jgi:hypothetical protein